MYQITPVVRNLLIANLVIFVLSITLSFNPLFALYNVYSEHFKPYQFITYMFLHADFGHIFRNMLGLFFFGPMLEMVWGAKRFFIFYLICGLGAGFTQASIDFYQSTKLKQDVISYKDSPSADKFAAIVHHYIPELEQQVLPFENEYAQHESDASYISQSIKYVNDIYDLKIEFASMVGASGAIFGILMAFALLFPNTEMLIMFLPIPIKAKYLVTVYGLYEIYLIFNPTPGDHVAHVAHLGGMLFALIMILMWRNDRKNFY